MKIIVWCAAGLFCLFWYNELKSFFDYQPPAYVDQRINEIREPIDRWIVRTRSDVQCVTETGETVVYKTIERMKVE